MCLRALPVRAALLAAGLLPFQSPQAQTHRATKAEKVTRAVGVYEWTGELDKPTASRFVPVSLFIDGHLVDAGVYLARPVPFALSPGYVYAVEKAGEPLGTVDLSEARNIVPRRSAEDDNTIGAWFGYGRYIPPPPAAKAPPLHTSTHPSVIVASDARGRPRFSNRSTEGDASSKSKPSATAGSSPASEPKPAETTPAPAATEDPDRPHMSRRSDSAPPTTSEPSASPEASSAPAAKPASDDDAERPTLRRHDTKPEGKRRGKESGSGVTPMATSLNDDPDRPTMRRGSEDTPGATPPLNGNPPGLHQAIAVSDAATIDSHLFAREWESPAERASTLAAFQTLARPRVANYLVVNQLKPGAALKPAMAPMTAAGAPTAKPGAQPTSGEDTGAPPKLQRGRPVQTTSPLPSATSSQPAAPAGTASRAITRSPTRGAGRRVPPAAASPLLLAEEQLAGFTLSYGGLPTFVYTAVTPTSEGPVVHITLVAQQLPSGEFQVALSSVTDDAHLDRVPWMRLIDVVDPNNSHRASFVFELRAKNSRQFALYKLVSAQAEQAFVTGLMQ